MIALHTNLPPNHAKFMSYWDMENITKTHMPYFLLHVVSNVSIFFLQALELMLVDALLLANDHLKLTSHIEGPSRFWKVCVMNFFTIYVLELRHHKCYSSFLSLVVLFWHSSFFQWSWGLWILRPRNYLEMGCCRSFQCFTKELVYDFQFAYKVED